MQLNTIKSAEGAKHARKRVGAAVRRAEAIKLIKCATT